MSETSFDVPGFKELMDKMEQLPIRLEKSVMRGAIRAGSKIVADQARRNAPVLQTPDKRRVFGALAKSIRVMATGVKNSVVRGGVVAGGKTSVGRGKNKEAADAFYAMWVEYGHLIRTAGQRLMGGTRSKQAQRASLAASGAASVPPHPFMRPAIDSKTQAAIDATAQYIRDRVESELLK